MKKMFKKAILSALLTCTMTAGLMIGCVAASADDTAAADLFDCAAYKSEKEQKDWTIAVVTKDNTADWFKRMGTGVDQFGKDTGISVISKGPANADAASQVQVVDDLINQGVDAICVVPIDPGALEASLQRAMEQGIVVVSHEASTLTNTLYDVEAFTPESYGSTIMDELAEAMGEEGKYALMVAYTTTATHMEYSKAEYEHQLEAYPNMELIKDGTIPSAEYEESINLAYERAKELIKETPDLKGFAGVVNEGVAKAIEELGVDATMVGVGTPNQFRQYVNSGTVKSVVLWDPMAAGYAMCSIAQKILSGEEVGAGADLGITGYENVTETEATNRLLIGDAALIVNQDNIGDFDF